MSAVAPIVLKNSKIVGLQKSRKCRGLASSATARPCGMDKRCLQSRFVVINVVPRIEATEAHQRR